jgi:hypothetical protein
LRTTIVPRMLKIATTNSSINVKPLRASARAAGGRCGVQVCVSVRGGRGVPDATELLSVLRDTVGPIL